MIGEVVSRACKQHEGLLLRSILSESEHLSLLNEYESALREQLQHQPLLLFFDARYVFHGQLRLLTQAVPPESQDFCLALFENRKKSLEFTALHLISHAQWQKATLSETRYKVLFLAQSLNIPLSNTPMEQDMNVLTDQASFLSIEPLEIQEEEEEMSSECAATRPIFSWLHLQSWRNLEPVDEVKKPWLEHYIQFVLDVALQQRYFPKHKNLRSSLLTFHATHIGGHHSHLSLLFLALMIDSSAKSMNSQAMCGKKEYKEGECLKQEMTCLLWQEWLNAECFLFQASQLSHSHSQFLEYTAFLRLYLPPPLLPNWINYHFEEDHCQYYWQVTAEKKYKLRMEWLLRSELAQLFCKVVPQRGFVTLSQREFLTLFLPTLYRLILIQTYYYLHMHRTSVLDSLAYAYHYREDGELNRMCHLLKNVKLSQPTQMFDLASELGTISSPVIKKLVRKHSAFDQALNPMPKKWLNWTQVTLKRQEMPDLEDLEKRHFLPPCLVPLFQSTHLGNMDRVTIAHYLVDLGYEKEEVVEYFGSKEKTDASYPKVLANTFEQCKKDKSIKLREDQKYISLGCSSIINTVSKEKNTFRCPFEAKANKQKRRKDHQWSEKKVFMTQCRATLNPSSTSQSPEYILHPIQYMLLQMNK